MSKCATLRRSSVAHSVLTYSALNRQLVDFGVAELPPCPSKLFNTSPTEREAALDVFLGHLAELALQRSITHSGAERAVLEFLSIASEVYRASALSPVSVRCWVAWSVEGLSLLSRGLTA